jgi:Tol biopolymer transport system component
MNADGSNPIQLTFDFTRSHFDPTWSPDSTKIAHSSDNNFDANIYVMNANGTGRTLRRKIRYHGSTVRPRSGGCSLPPGMPKQ